jgi:hypothetical protein
MFLAFSTSTSKSMIWAMIWAIKPKLRLRQPMLPLVLRFPRLISVTLWRSVRWLNLDLAPVATACPELEVIPTERYATGLTARSPLKRTEEPLNCLLVGFNGLATISPKFISGWGNEIGETTEIRLLETGARSELTLSVASGA